MIILKFVIGGSWLLALVTETEAREIVQNWMSGYYRLKDIKVIGTATPPPKGWIWSIEVDKIHAIHALTPADTEVVLEQAHTTKTQPKQYQTLVLSGSYFPNR